MNLLLFSSSQMHDGNKVTISDPEKISHITNILKKDTGSTLRSGMINGLMGHATILKLSPDIAEFEVLLDTEAPLPLPLTLICALPRPKVFRRILFSACCMGVKNFHFIKTWRVDKSYWESPLLSPESITTIFHEALTQCGDTIEPRIEFHRLFRPFAEDCLDSISENTLKLVAHPYCDNKFPFAVNTASTLIIGPEGGFIPFEIEFLTMKGFVPVSLGTRILTVETAVPALISRLFP